MGTRLSFARLLSAMLLIGTLLWGQPGFSQQRPGVDCNCTENDGTYKQGAKAKKPYLDCVPPINPDYCKSPDDEYRVTASGTNQVTLAVSAFPGGQTILSKTIPLTAAFWGFSPDDARFAYHYTTTQGSETMHHVGLHNLADNPDTAIYERDEIVGQATAPLFSPNGKYLLYVNVTGTTHSLIRLVETGAGNIVYGDAFDYAVPVDGDPFPDFPEITKWGGVTWGFSPDKKDASFVYVWRSGLNTVEWNLVNLVSGIRVRRVTANAAGVDWEFSPCGDVVAYIENRTEVWLFSTNTSNQLVDRDFTPSVIQDNGLRSAADSHEALVGNSYQQLAQNTAHDSCGSPADRDGDGISDGDHNCPDKPNPGQDDSDRDGTVSAAGNRTFVIENLAPYATYAFKVEAGDNDGMWSSDGPSLWRSTIDVTAPIWPDGSTLASIPEERTETRLTLQWTEAQDNHAVAGYKIYRRVSDLAWIMVVSVPADVLTYRLTCLRPYNGNNSCTFKVEGYDAAGNERSDGPQKTMYTKQGDECGTYTDRASISSDGEQGMPIDRSGGEGGGAGGEDIFPANSTNPDMSADGRQVVFESEAQNLVDDDSNWAIDIFVHDRQTGETKRVSVSSDGSQGSGSNSNPAISADGRCVAFASIWLTQTKVRISSCTPSRT